MLVHPGQDERVLVGEKLVDGPHGDIRLAGDVLHGRRADAETPKATLGGIEDALALEVLPGGEREQTLKK